MINKIKFLINKINSLRKPGNYTIIIPTIWSPEREFIFKLLSDLDRCPYVGEVILIDNAPEKKIQIPYFSKLKILYQSENIFVNPAWNLGVEEATFNKIVLLNDDINTDWNLLEYINNFFKETKISIGLLGIDSSCMKSQEKNIQFRFTNQRNRGFGCLMILKKETYSHIPSAIKILSGDSYLFQSSLSQGKINVAICGWPLTMANNKMSVSSSNPKFDSQKKNGYGVISKLK